MIGTYPEADESEFDIYIVKIVDKSLYVDRMGSSELENFYGNKQKTRKVKYNMDETAFFYGTDLSDDSYPDSFYEQLAELVIPYNKWAEWHLSHVTANKSWDDLDDGAFENNIETFDKWQGIVVDINQILIAIKNRYG